VADSVDKPGLAKRRIRPTRKTILEDDDDVDSKPTPVV
jgi:hypothetical protein